MLFELQVKHKKHCSPPHTHTHVEVLAPLAPTHTSTHTPIRPVAACRHSHRLQNSGMFHWVRNKNTKQVICTGINVVAGTHPRREPIFKLVQISCDSAERKMPPHAAFGPRRWPVSDTWKRGGEEQRRWGWRGAAANPTLPCWLQSGCGAPRLSPSGTAGTMSRKEPSARPQLLGGGNNPGHAEAITTSYKSICFK